MQGVIPQCFKYRIVTMISDNMNGNAMVAHQDDTQTRNKDPESPFSEAHYAHGGR